MHSFYLSPISPIFHSKEGMATFSELSQGSYFIIQENDHGSLDLVFVPMVTEKCVLLEFQDEEQTTMWRRLSDPIHEVVEKLTLEQAIIFENYKAGGMDNDGTQTEEWLEDEEEETNLWDEEDDLDFLSKN